jgi:hypothetical protein
MIHRSGLQRVTFFNEFDVNTVYGAGFPSRWDFAEQCIRKFNNRPVLRDVILAAIDPVRLSAPQSTTPEQENSYQQTFTRR